jgi:hypothetical protein
VVFLSFYSDAEELGKLSFFLEGEVFFEANLKKESTMTGEKNRSGFVYPY